MILLHKNQLTKYFPYGFCQIRSLKKCLCDKVQSDRGNIVSASTIKEGGKQSLSFPNFVFASAAALASHCMCQFCISLATGTLQAPLCIMEIHFLLLPEGDPGAWNLGTAFCPAAGPGHFSSHFGCNLLEGREHRILLPS